MNIPRLILSIFVLFLFISIFDFLIHGILLSERYGATADSWRSEEEMLSRLPLQYSCYLVTMIGFATIWALGFPGKGVKCGAIYGFLVGLIANAGILIMFVFTPIPDEFMLPWMLSGMAGSILSGIVVAGVYQPKPEAAKAE